jgi:hypothetical protein
MHIIGHHFDLFPEKIYKCYERHVRVDKIVTTVELFSQEQSSLFS